MGALIQRVLPRTRLYVNLSALGIPSMHFLEPKDLHFPQ